MGFEAGGVVSIHAGPGDGSAAGGPLAGLRVLEIAGIGPGPHAATLLADLGAHVFRIERPGGQLLSAGERDLLTRGRSRVVLDLKHRSAAATVLELARTADIVMEGMRPGVAERLGIGPAECHDVNPALVYGRMTGWGQTGPLAQSAGHDINYLSIAGVLHGLGQDSQRPQFPANLLGDFGGGSLYLVVGLLAAVLNARRTGVGDVVDAAIVDGSSHLATMVWSFMGDGAWTDTRGTNLLDGGRPFYDIYETSDGRHLAVGALEPQFFHELVRLLGVAGVCPPQGDAARYPEMRELFASTIGARTLAEWSQIFDGTDACATPVLTPEEAAVHPHVVARGTMVVRDGVLQPIPAPRFANAPATLGALPPPATERHAREALHRWGIDPEPLIASGVVVADD